MGLLRLKIVQLTSTITNHAKDFTIRLSVTFLGNCKLTTLIKVKLCKSAKEIGLLALIGSKTSEIKTLAHNLLRWNKKRKIT